MPIRINIHLSNMLIVKQCLQILYLCGHFNIFIILLHIILLLYMGFVFMKYRADVSLCCSILISYMPLTLISGRLLFMVCINDEKNTNNMWHPVFDWRNIINNVYISLMLFQWWPWKLKEGLYTSAYKNLYPYDLFSTIAFHT